MSDGTATQASSQHPEPAPTQGLMQGVVKIYDPNTGAGVIILDADRSEVYLRPGSLQGSLFRLLRQGQRIMFHTEESDGRRYAHTVTIGSDGR